MIPGGMLAAGGPMFVDECADITTWTDGDTGSGSSTQTTFGGEGVFSMSSGTPAPGVARRTRVLPVTIPTYVNFILRLYHSALGSTANNDHFRLFLENGTGSTDLAAFFATDGLFINDGTSNVEVGTNIVSTGAWAIWQFSMNFSSNKADVYKDGVLQGSGFDLRSNVLTANNCQIDQLGNTTENMLTYIDYMRIE